MGSTGIYVNSDNIWSVSMDLFCMVLIMDIYIYGHLYLIVIKIKQLIMPIVIPHFICLNILASMGPVWIQIDTD